MNWSADYGITKSNSTDYTKEEERVVMFCRQNDGLLLLMQTRMNPFLLACLRLKCLNFHDYCNSPLYNLVNEPNEKGRREITMVLQTQLRNFNFKL